MLSAFLDNRNAMINKVGPVSILKEPGILTNFFGVSRSQDSQGESYSSKKAQI